MICECFREHLILGEVSIDGIPIPLAWIEVTAGLYCKHRLRRDPETKPLDEPDA